MPCGESLAEAQDGLSLKKKVVVKEDGRYIIFYTFAEGRKAEPKGGEERRPCQS